MTGSDRTDHYSRGVTAKCLLEHTSQVWVTIGNVRTWLGLAGCLISQRRDNITQRCKWLVNRVTFLESVARGTCLCWFFRTSQINKVNLCVGYKVSRRRLGNSFKRDSDHSVCPWRRSVHLGLANRSVLVTLIHKSLNLGVVRYSYVHRLRNFDFARHLPYLEILLAFLWCVNEQVLQFLHIDFDDAHCHLVANVCIFVCIDSLKELICTDRDDPFIHAVAELRIGFTRAGLTVSK